MCSTRIGDLISNKDYRRLRTTKLYDRLQLSSEQRDKLPSNKTSMHSRRNDEAIELQIPDGTTKPSNESSKTLRNMDYVMSVAHYFWSICMHNISVYGRWPQKIRNIGATTETNSRTNNMSLFDNSFFFSLLGFELKELFFFFGTKQRNFSFHYIFSFLIYCIIHNSHCMYEHQPCRHIVE